MPSSGNKTVARKEDNDGCIFGRFGPTELRLLVRGGRGINSYAGAADLAIYPGCELQVHEPGSVWQPEANSQTETGQAWGYPPFFQRTAKNRTPTSTRAINQNTGPKGISNLANPSALALSGVSYSQLKTR